MNNEIKKKKIDNSVKLVKSYNILIDESVEPNNTKYQNEKQLLKNQEKKRRIYLRKHQ